MSTHQTMGHSQLIETTVADVLPGQVSDLPGWRATIHRCGGCDGSGYIICSDYEDRCPICSGDGILWQLDRHRPWWRTPLELAAAALFIGMGWAALVMLP